MGDSNHVCDVPALMLMFEINRNIMEISRDETQNQESGECAAVRN